MPINEPPTNPSSERKSFSEWLTNLQQESWQLELLISAFAIFGLISVQEKVTEWALFIDSGYLNKANRFLVLGIGIVAVGTVIFKINLLFHLLVRDYYNIVSNEEGFNYTYYDDERVKHSPKKTIDYFSIPSKRMQGTIGEVFIRQNSYHDYYIGKNHPHLEPVNAYKSLLNRPTMSTAKEVKKYKEVKKPPYQKNVREIKEILQQQFNIQIDQQTTSKQQMTCDFFQHANAKERGLLCFFPLPPNLSIGRHYLTLQRQTYHRTDFSPADTLDVTIPFIYEGK